MTNTIRILTITAVCAVVACSEKPAEAPVEAPNTKGAIQAESSFTATAKPTDAVAITEEVAVNEYRDVFFGNLHVHTSYSFDGYTNGSPTTPGDAYRWAKGDSINGGGDGSTLTIKKPLDWYAVSDHAEYLGVFKKMEDPSSPASKVPMAERITSDDQKVAFSAYSDVLAAMAKGEAIDELLSPELTKTIWQEVTATADAHNKPGSFTTFPAFEWTSHPGSRNIHRVVLFQSSNNLPIKPFSVLDSDRPEDLWAWMGEQRDNGAELLAVPHNGNASDGLMFPVVESYGGSDIDSNYTKLRMLNEPLYEITQIKGTSETHPALSPLDEYAGFELWDYTLSDQAVEPNNKKGGYAREAITRGLKLAAEDKGNPFKFGFIGDSDTHNAAATIEEDNYTGKFGMENNVKYRVEGIPGFPERNNRQMREFSSGGVAAVWAKANTREEIFAAMMRKETYATTGPRMMVRMFAGFDFSADLLEQSNWLELAYATGVPMGGDLTASEAGQAPSFIVTAVKEADGANLDRIQIIKGWVEAGEEKEAIYNVALSDNRVADADGNVPPIANTVDAATATYSNDVGATELQVIWQDPDFNAEQAAVYYARVIEIATPRWSTYDAKTLGVAPGDDVPVSIQERAFTSPIWYTP